MEAWHDLPRQVQRSWKQYRRTQYKGKDTHAKKSEGGGFGNGCGDDPCAVIDQGGRM